MVDNFIEIAKLAGLTSELFSSSIKATSGMSSKLLSKPFSKVKAIAQPRSFELQPVKNGGTIARSATPTGTKNIKVWSPSVNSVANVNPIKTLKP